MSVEVKIPAVGESVTEALISQWFKAEGDAVAEDEPIVELETDKVTVELPAPAAGVLSKILMKEGETAQIGDVIATIEEGATAATSAPATRSSEAIAPPSSGATGQGEEKAEQESAKAESTGAATTEAAGAAGARSKVEAKKSSAAPTEQSGAPRVMPAAQRLLHEQGLEASEVPASGPGGRLLKEDVERHIAGREKTETPEKKPAAAASKGPGAPSSAERLEEAVPMTPIRKRIAERLVAAQENAALLTTFNEVDMSAVVGLRTDYKEAFEKRHGIKLGFMSFFVKASVDALRQFPQINAEIRDESIVYRNYYDIGIAVSTPRGLMVPVLRSAERMSFAEIEAGITDFGTRARDGKIKLEDLEGGTFTITNGGIFGSMLSTPIINPPQSGVLGLHAIQDRPVAIDGEVVIRPIMYVALTYDHRIVDGREAVTFLRRIKETIEQPSRMLLEV